MSLVETKNENTMRYKCFNNNIALVTGAQRGIGLEVAKQLHSQGAIVICLDVNYPNKTLIEVSTHFYNVYADVADIDSIHSLIETIEKDIGPINYLASVAGILRVTSLLDIDENTLDALIEVNTKGAFFICRNVALKMKSRKKGSIVAVSSNAASTPRINIGAYGASKSALNMLIKTLALEVAPFNIRCNLVSPGSTLTKMQTDFASGPDAQKSILNGSLEQFRLGVPLNKMATPEDIANSIVYLLSEQALQITMHDLVVDGGATLGV
ncbi:SDR family oxidoreductase [Marinicellulosiphila megalodicopiae]|uniref:SDR family oxidoreductase n=1 Tax=Marinicellulosiphila megalodicopiae TaxID=2724896 RepID=UPI003BB11C37